MVTQTEPKKPLNVHQRKLAAMAMVKGISPDKKHPHHKFDYVSIQNLSDSLRDILVEVGLDVVSGVDPDNHLWRVQLINVEDPTDRIVEHFPLIPEDKGWAYTTKYPLIRLFLVGDGEEGDEAETAKKSGDVATKFAEGVRPVPRRELTSGGGDSAPIQHPIRPLPPRNGTPHPPTQGRLLREEEPPPPSDEDAPVGARR